ncbi:hypothetical protein BDW22DRAFT_1305488, partial [Trametopsis cervina]
PSYSPSLASPEYSVEPQDDERRLELSTLKRRSVPSDTYTRTSRTIKVVLHDQESGAMMPTYVRGAVIKGEIEFCETEVLSVTAKLEGRQTLSVGEASYMEHVLFSEEHQLWFKRDTTLGDSSRHLFHIPFPINHTTDKGTFPNPPSFDVRYTGAPSLDAHIIYSLTFIVTKPIIGSWKKHNNVSIPLKYAPRSRPYLPIAPSLYPFLSTVKTCPEDWRQISSNVSYKKRGPSAIDCHLFIPSVQIFALTDTIPFHLQLRGPAELMKQYTETQDHLHVPTPGSLLGTLSDSFTAVTSASQKPRVRVYLLRQTSLRVHAHRAWKNVVIGEGTLRPIEKPPSWSAAFGRQEEELVLDWEGEVRVNDDVKVASFIAGDLHVKDFIAVKLSPKNPGSSSLAEHENTHPIRIVTDTYMD